MYKRSIYLEITFLPTYLPTYRTYFPTDWVTKGKPEVKSGEVHPQLSHNGYPLGGALVGACSHWPT
jgi:hypothetical protein